MRFPATLKKLIDGKYQIRCIGTIAGEITVVAATREAAIESAKSEIRYRIEWCPCSAVSDEYVELKVRETLSVPRGL